MNRALVLAAAAFVVYNLNFSYQTSEDSLPAKLLPYSILRNHDFYLDWMPKTGRNSQETHSLIHREGRVLSGYPVVAPVLAAPFYAPFVLYRHFRHYPDMDAFHDESDGLEKLSASALTAASVAFLYLALETLFGRRRALFLSVLYAFATSTWYTSSQALWQHGPAELLLAVLLWLVVCHENGPPMVFAGMGAVAALLSADRPPNVVFALALAVWCALRHPRRLPLIVAGAMPVAALVVASDLVYFHTWLGSYGGFVSVYGKERTPLLPGIAARLLAPGIGLLVYSPFFIFLLLLLRRPPHPALDAPPSPTRGEGGLPSPPAGEGGSPQQSAGDPGEGSRLALSLPLFLRLALVACAVLTILYGRASWPAGFGPRYMTDMLPVLVAALGPVLPLLSGAARGLFFLLAAWSMLLQAILVFWAGLPATYFHTWAASEFPPWTMIRYGEPAYPELLAPRLGIALDGGGIFFPSRLLWHAKIPLSECRLHWGNAVIPPRMAAGETTRASVTVTNASGTVWMVFNLSYHLTGLAPGLPAVFEGPRTHLPILFRPRQSATLLAEVSPPAKLPPGPYRIDFDVVQERNTWFSWTGVATLPREVTIEAPRSRNRDAGSRAGGR
jgi:hypothetical protein